MQWRALHIGCSNDADLRALGKRMPGLGDIGINVLIVEVLLVENQLVYGHAKNVV